MQKLKTQTYYRQKAEVVLQYICNNLDGDLSLKTLSEKSGISHFHFHRVMRAALGEPLGSYIDRSRLETAITLIRYGDMTMQDIAGQIGYQDLSSFSKAFAKEFGVSPNDYKADHTLMFNTHIDYQLNATNKLISDIKPKITVLADKMVYFIRVKGKYGGPEVEKAWEEMSAFTRKTKITGWNPDIFSIYYDDSEIVGYENAISEICIASKKLVETTGNIEIKNIRGGKYVIFRYKGPYHYLWDLYDSIYKVWVVDTDCKLRDAPVIEKYIKYSKKTKPEDLLTEIHIPIE